MISQRLIPRSDGQGRRAAIEILLNSPFISDLIFKGEVHAIKELMAKSKEMGMQTFDQALYDLYEAGDVSYEDALRNADSMSELKLAIKLNSKRARAADAEGKPKVELSLHEEKKEEEAPAEMFSRPASPMPAPAVQVSPSRPAA